MWYLYFGVCMEFCVGMLEDDGLMVWVDGGYVEIFVLMGDVIELIDDMYFFLYGCKIDLINIVGKCLLLVYLNY